MKTILGKVGSSKHTSLSNAARVLSTFIGGGGNEISTDVSTYLSRTSASFNELVKFHRDIKRPNSDQKHRNHVKEVGDDVKIEQSRGDSEEVGKKQKREKRKESENGGEILDLEEMGGSPKRKKKRRKTEANQFISGEGPAVFGPYCQKHRPPDRYSTGPLVLNSLDLPKRPGERCYIFYMKNRYCVFGVACRYHHPEPVTTGTSPDYRHANYGPTGSSAVTFTDQHSASGVLSFSFPAASSSSDQDLQRVKIYTLLVISPSHGVSPLYGRSSYLGNTSCVPSVRVNGAAVIYSTCPGAFNYSSLFPTFFYYLPVRPDLPKCREFMNSGTCRFGFNCRYHHPREEKAQTITYFIRPLGFPSRPVVDGFPRFCNSQVEEGANIYARPDE